MQLLDELKKNPFVLAPMAGITDTAFRSFMKEMGAGIVISELVSGDGIEHQNANTLRLMRYDEDQRPVAIQLFGEDPIVVGRAAKFVQNKGADFVDLNFGCPVPKVVKRGAGSAILRDPLALKIMVSTVKRYIDVPLTIKIRTGWDESTRNAVEVANIAYNEGVTWVAIHGRTRAQGYSGLADWDFIGDVKAKTKIPIIGNGDIHTADQAVTRLKTYGLDGVMIGRGCLKNPWIFAESRRLYNLHDQKEIERDFRTAFFTLKTYLDKVCDDKLMHIQLKKFGAWFSAGYPGASKFRKALFESKTVAEVWATLNNYFNEVKNLTPADTSNEDFLMGGHG
jgi:tRNA-dihydrouridine synthase B